MKPILRATALLSSSSAVSVFAAIATSKFYAVHIDADGIGLNALMQSILGLGLLLATFGVPTGLTRQVSAAFGADNRDTQLSALFAARRITLFTSLVVFGCLVLWPRIAAAALGEGRVQTWQLAVLAAAGCLSTWTGVQTAYLNGHQKIGELARLGIYSSLASAVVAIGCVGVLGLRGLAPALLGTSIVGALLAQVSVRRAGIPTSGSATRTASELRTLVRFGFPMTLSSLLGTGMQLVLPILVLHVLDRDSVGVFRAAASISVTYIGLLLAAMSQDYYPRVAAASPESLGEILNVQHRMVTLLALPIVAMGALVSPVLIPLLYKSGRFIAAVPVLQWQLIGDLLRVSSWTMSYVVLARSGSAAFFLLEALGGLAFLSTSWAGMRLFGIEGSGIGFLAGYALYWLIAAVLLRRTQRVSLDRTNTLVALGAAGGLLLVQLMARRLGPAAGFALRGAIAVLIVAISGTKLWREIRPRLGAASS